MLSPIRLFRPVKAPRRSPPRPSTTTAPRFPTAEKAAAEPDVTPDIDKLRICSADGGWKMVVDDLGTPAWTVSTKKKAVSAGRRAAQDLNCLLVIETARGKVQKTLDFTKPENAA